MKRAFIAILSLFYLLVTSGFVINIHYCMGEIAAIGVGADKTDVCGGCGMEEKDYGCCHTDEQHYKVDDAHQAASQFFAQMQEPAIVPVTSFYESFVPLLNAERIAIDQQYHSPPDPRLNEVFLHNCHFRI